MSQRGGPRRNSTEIRFSKVVDLLKNRFPIRKSNAKLSGDFFPNPKESRKAFPTFWASLGYLSFLIARENGGGGWERRGSGVNGEREGGGNGLLW